MRLRPSRAPAARACRRRRRALRSSGSPYSRHRPAAAAATASSTRAPASVGRRPGRSGRRATRVQQQRRVRLRVAVAQRDRADARLRRPALDRLDARVAAGRRRRRPPRAWPPSSAPSSATAATISNAYSHDDGLLQRQGVVEIERVAEDRVDGPLQALVQLPEQVGAGPAVGPDAGRAQQVGVAAKVGGLRVAEEVLEPGGPVGLPSRGGCVLVRGGFERDGRHLAAGRQPGRRDPADGARHRRQDRRALTAAPPPAAQPGVRACPAALARSPGTAAKPRREPSGPRRGSSGTRSTRSPGRCYHTRGRTTPPRRPVELPCGIAGETPGGHPTYNELTCRA